MSDNESGSKAKLRILDKTKGSRPTNISKYDNLQKNNDIQHQPQRKQNSFGNKIPPIPKKIEKIIKIIFYHLDTGKEFKELGEILNDFISQRVKELKNPNFKLLKEIEDLIQRYSHRRYHDIEIKISQEKELNTSVEFIETLGIGGYGKADLVYYLEEICVRKTSIFGPLEKEELKILRYLDGAGGAPKLLAATDTYFLCSYVGDRRFGDLITIDFRQEDCLHAMMEIAKKVKEIHDLEICHNDIKTDNVMYDKKTNMFSLIDFGLGRHSGEVVFKKSELKIFDSCTWMSPEVRKGHECTSASDIYSLGFMLGQITFGLGDPSPWTKALVGKAISEDPKERPSIEEFIAVLFYRPISENKKILSFQERAEKVFQLQVTDEVQRSPWIESWSNYEESNI